MMIYTAGIGMFREEEWALGMGKILKDHLKS